MTFDMRRSLYDDWEDEGFPNATFPQGVVASFTLPKTFALEDDTRYKWRFYAFDGYLMSKPSKTFYMKVDSFSPIGHASSPKYSTSLDFEVTWSSEDVTTGSCGPRRPRRSSTARRAARTTSGCEPGTR
jgi:hypothetical protein